MITKYNCEFIVFFDGHCGLCNKSVDFLMNHDTTRKFKYSPLQSELFRTLKNKDLSENVDSLYVYDGKDFYIKTRGWMILAKELGGVWKALALIANILPDKILDFFYDQIAKHRYKIFGRRDQCRMPTAEERELFIT